MAEAAKKLDYPTPAHAEADKLLAQAAALTATLSSIQKECQVEASALAAKHKKKVGPVKKGLEKLGAQIASFAKKHQVDLFEDRDRIDLLNGALLHQEGSHVIKPRGIDMLARLKELGIADGIKISELVDWDTIEQWPDERLIEIGTERVKDDKFAYELYAQEEAKSPPKARRKAKK
jgi:type III secretion system FlhB-like substrate exporter